MFKILLYFGLISSAYAEFKMPELLNPVNDYSNVLSVSDKELVATAIVETKKQTGAQVGIMIVDTLDGTPIEDVATVAFHKWKLGSKERDDGLLMIFVTKDHKMRMEVGYGLEGIITDMKAKRILGSLKPFLQKNDYTHALLSAVSQTGTMILDHKAEITSKPVRAEDNSAGIGLFSIIGLFVLWVMYVMLRRKEPDSVLSPSSLSKGDPLNMYKDKISFDHVKTYERKHYKPTKKSGPVKESDSGSDLVTKIVVAKVITDSFSSSRDDSSSSSSDDSSSSSSSDSSNSGSDWGGGGGDSGGGGASDSW